MDSIIIKGEKILLNDIIMVTADRSYCWFHLIDRKILSSKPTSYHDLTGLVKLNKSVYINPKCVESVEGRRVTLTNGYQEFISFRRLDEVNNLLKSSPALIIVVCLAKVRFSWFVY